MVRLTLNVGENGIRYLRAVDSIAASDLLNILGLRLTVWELELIED